MDKKNYYLALTYDLFVGEEKELMEQATIERPLCFYSGLGMMLDKFEELTVGLEMNDTFDFVISNTDAYGEYDSESVIDLPKNIFEVDGKIDKEVLFEGNVVPLQDQEGNKINASIVSVGEDTVTVDLNHPLAGEDLHFVGKILVKREADEDEIRNLMTQNSCGSCSGGCGSDDCESSCCGCN